MRRKRILTIPWAVKGSVWRWSPDQTPQVRSSDEALLAGLHVQDESPTSCGALTGGQGGPGPAGQKGFRPFT